MTFETYDKIFLITIVLASIMFVITGTLFFLMKIPKTIGILSGITQKKAINRIRLKHNIPQKDWQRDYNKSTVTEQLHEEIATDFMEQFMVLEEIAYYDVNKVIK